MTRFILVTGRIASGKSKVADLLSCRKHRVVKLDDLAKEIYGSGKLNEYLLFLFGNDAFKDGKINYEYLRSAMFTKDEERGQFEYLLGRAIVDKLQDQYEGCLYPVFLEAAPIESIGFLVNRLGIKDIVQVECPDKIRESRALERGTSASLFKMADAHQDFKHLYRYESPAEWMPARQYDNPDVTIYKLENNGPLKALADALEDVLEKIPFEHSEKVALFIENFKSAPTYGQANTMCYMYHNMGLCYSCPFPCECSDRHWEAVLKHT